VYILIGVTPLKNYKTTAYMNHRIPGVFVPDKVLKRMESAHEKGNEQEEGVQIALELIEKIKVKQGVHGLHIMAVGWDEIIPRIMKDAGLSTAAAS
jgi:5,10-methylenetetrahydrofolate reductase